MSVNIQMSKVVYRIKQMIVFVFMISVWKYPKGKPFCSDSILKSLSFHDRLFYSLDHGMFLLIDKTKVLQRFIDAVSIDISRHIICQSLYLGITIAHGDSFIDIKQHITIVFRIAKSHRL